MSTIESMESSKVLTVDTPVDGGVFLIIAGPVGAGHAGADGRQMAIRVSAADLLAAIEAEGIGVVVEGTLPEVTVDGDLDRVKVGGHWFFRHRRAGDLEFVREAIAAHRHFDANPPAPEVDEADVEALVALTTEIDRSCNAKRTAREFLASGRVTVTR